MARAAVVERRCQICGLGDPDVELRPAGIVRSTIVEQIRKTHPQWSSSGFICLADLDRFRNAYVHALIEVDKGELSSLEKEVLESLVRHETLSVDTEREWERELGFGQRLADRVADFGGSWRFILMFLAIMAVWMGLNVGLLFAQPFDPYPFILLNLVLSCLAAMQAPVIMMSQNRQEERDRLRARKDYQINLKAELEIRQLHEKVDHLLLQQWARLMEIQEIQIDLMNELMRRRSSSSPGGA
jgi:uncharacterized membrane protein